jgi:hypothetical protein
LLDRKTESGQTIILVVISILIMVVMAALIVDGGNLYLNRRHAQTAADAAALAAAYEYCVNHGSLADANAAAEEYALVHNGGTVLVDLDGNPSNSIEILFDVADKEVTVEVEITKPTFFAKVFGIKEETVRADASADCLIPGGLKGNLAPIAWTCRPPVGGDVGDCAVEKIPFEVYQEIKGSFNFSKDILDVGDGSTAASYMTDLDGSLGEGKALYIVLDTDKFDETTDCQLYGGPVLCDFNGDGEVDIAAGGNRGWLYLEGNASDLDNIMMSGTEGVVPKNKWFPGKPGSDDNVVSVAHDHKVGEIVLIPIFDKICETNDFYADCDYVSPPDTVWEWSGNYTYYHIVDFGAFLITCVYDNVKDSCPGRDYAGLKKNDANTIEGYFLDGYAANGIDGGGDDLGVYVISLTE